MQNSFTCNICQVVLNIVQSSQMHYLLIFVKKILLLTKHEFVSCSSSCSKISDNSLQNSDARDVTSNIIVKQSRSFLSTKYPSSFTKITLLDLSQGLTRRGQLEVVRWPLASRLRLLKRTTNSKRLKNSYTKKWE